MGITSDLFATEHDGTSGCATAAARNSDTRMSAAAGINALSSTEMVGIFGRFLAPPAPAKPTPGGAASSGYGKDLFANTGCGLRHTPSLTTGNSNVAALRNQSVHRYSDLALHQMGPHIGDDIQQSAAAGDESRSAPLWGLGQRIFFLHDGRTSDLAQAIELQASRGDSEYGPSEAHAVLGLYKSLIPNGTQDLLNFRRAL